MTDDRKAGVALIAGSLGEVLTMAIHPVAGTSMTPEGAAHLARLSGVAHSLALVSAALLFLGACGLTRRIGGRDRLALSALVAFGFASVALMIATAVSGFILPDIMGRMANDIPAAEPQWRMLITAIFEFNQTFSRILVIASSAAIFLWSAGAIRNSGLTRAVAIYGCFVAPLIIAGVVIGHLRMNVHGMMLVVLGQTVWFVVAGGQMWARPISSS